MSVYFLVSTDTLLLDLAGIAEAFRIANQMAACKHFDLHFVGEQADLPSSVGIHLAALEPLPSSLYAPAWLVVCGVRNPEVAIAKGALRAEIDWLRQVAGLAQKICCVCAGSLIAAEAGLLYQRSCTSHHAHTDWLRREHAEARVLDNRIFVQDADLYTSAGVTAGIDLALALIGEKAGANIASAVARDLVVFSRRVGADRQISPWLAQRNHLHPLVHRLQDELAARPLEPWTLQRIAQRGNISVRTLSRLFTAETGASPLDYLCGIRVSIACQHLINTRWPMERMAERSGFSTALQLRRVAKKHGIASLRAIRDERRA